jgi:hypothetical protein
MGGGMCGRGVWYVRGVCVGGEYGMGRYTGEEDM